MSTKCIKKIKMTKEIRKDFLKDLKNHLEDLKQQEQSVSRTIIEKSDVKKKLQNMPTFQNNFEAIFLQIQEQKPWIYNQYKCQSQYNAEEKLQNIIQKIKCMKQKKQQSNNITLNKIQMQKTLRNADENNASTIKSTEKL